MLTHQYYEDNKERILSDLDTLGRKQTEKDWQIKSGVMTVLIRRWKGDEFIAHRREYKKHVGGSKVGRNAPPVNEATTNALLMTVIEAIVKDKPKEEILRIGLAVKEELIRRIILYQKELAVIQSLLDYYSPGK